jgi:glucose-1-phosphate cytidylyltransferase
MDNRKNNHMKVVIFAGGLGTRISEESHLRPKPMIEIGGKPILWHIMKIYETQGFNEFIICLGYKGYMIKEYFMHYFMHQSDVTIDVRNNKVKIHQTDSENFVVTLVETGQHTRTAGRLKRIREYVGNEPFMLSYGDGVSDIDLNALIAFHQANGKICTMTAVQPEGRFGGVYTDTRGLVTNFNEKPKGDSNWINGGFFVLQPEVFDYLGDRADQEMWEESVLPELTRAKQLCAYQHRGFWKCMDAIRDKVVLEELWESGNANWKIWK